MSLFKTWWHMRGVEVYLHWHLISAPDRGDWSIHAPSALSRGKDPSAHGLGRWVGPRAIMEILEKRKNLLPLTGFEPLIVHPVSLVTILTAAYWLLKRGEYKIFLCFMYFCLHTYLFMSFCPNFVNMNSQQFLGRPIFLAK